MPAASMRICTSPATGSPSSISSIDHFSFTPHSNAPLVFTATPSPNVTRNSCDNSHRSLALEHVLGVSRKLCLAVQAFASDTSGSSGLAAGLGVNRDCRFSHRSHRRSSVRSACLAHRPPTPTVYTAGQAASIGHVAQHDLGAAAYAIKAVRCAQPGNSRAGRIERDWQRDKLPEPVRRLVLEDQARRNSICWSAFSD
ncbi:putative immunity protein [Rhodococcus spongiicola]|uniref:putative immunity protein n=1 Tax=Rhodococcus spongiicola TaxID=2487352 RepID=UPI0038B60D9E